MYHAIYLIECYRNELQDAHDDVTSDPQLEEPKVGSVCKAAKRNITTKQPIGWGRNRDGFEMHSSFLILLAIRCLVVMFRLTALWTLPTSGFLWLLTACDIIADLGVPFPGHCTVRIFLAPQWSWSWNVTVQSMCYAHPHRIICEWYSFYCLRIKLFDILHPSPFLRPCPYPLLPVIFPAEPTDTSRTIAASDSHPWTFLHTLLTVWYIPLSSCIAVCLSPLFDLYFIYVCATTYAYILHPFSLMLWPVLNETIVTMSYKYIAPNWLFIILAFLFLVNFWHCVINNTWELSIILNSGIT